MTFYYRKISEMEWMQMSKINIYKYLKNGKVNDQNK